jgi:hypothetical protein
VEAVSVTVQRARFMAKMLFRQTYHNKSTDPEEDQITPFFRIGWKQEPYSWQDELHDEADDGTPRGEVVY